MSIVTEPSNPPHPSWCAREHGMLAVHSGQVGADIELTSDLAYAIYLYQSPDEPAEVHLMRHTEDETSLTPFSILEAAILRDLIGEGLGLIAREAGL